jgi:hypothetical protein
MTVHTVTLEDQGIDRPRARIRWILANPGERCEGEVRSNGRIRQCKARPTMVVGGKRLCTIHGRREKGWER